jgi:beta-1,4-mannosyltransferase
MSARIEAYVRSRKSRNRMASGALHSRSDKLFAPMKVLAWPARRNRHRNPFNYLLSEALTETGCSVVELDRRNALLERSDIFHMHWPQQAAKGSILVAFGSSFMLLARMMWQTLLGAKVVWTVHNVRSHERPIPALEPLLMSLVTRLIHGAIFMTAASRGPAVETFPSLRSKPYAIIPHGLYSMRSDRSKRDARRLFDLPLDDRIIGFLGDIRRYKGLDRLLLALKEARPGAATLFVAGAFTDADCRGSVHELAAELGDRGSPVVFCERRLSDDELVDAIQACDFVALPYNAVWNSGLALLALGNGGRILTADAPAFRELRDELGADRVRIVEGDFDGPALMKALEGSTEELQAPEFAPERAWPAIGAATLAFYRRLGAG